jgi:hypothetical protein
VRARRSVRLSYDDRVKAALMFVLGLAACGGAPMQTVQIKNASPRPITELYVYPAGSTNHGASRGTVAPNGTTEVKVKQGNVEVLAVSSKMQVDEHTRDQPSASGTLELKGPAQVIFYDEGAAPPGVNNPGVFGFEFVIPKPKPAPTPE